MYEKGSLFFADFYRDGKRIRKSFPTAAAAKKFEKEQKAKAQKPKPSEPKNRKALAR